MDESDSVRRLKQGDITGLAALVDRYQIKAIRAAFLVTRERQLAEDIVQSAFLRVFDRIDQFDQRRPFGPWFLRIVVNDALKAAIRRDRQISLDQGPGEGILAGLIDDPELGPELLLEHAETRRTVQEALDRLSPNQRAAVVLRYFLGLTEPEIADQLECPPGTVKQRLHTARRRLRTVLGPLLQVQNGTNAPLPAQPVSLEAAPKPQQGGK